MTENKSFISNQVTFGNDYNRGSFVGLVIADPGCGCCAGHGENLDTVLQLTMFKSELEELLKITEEEIKKREK